MKLDEFLKEPAFKKYSVNVEEYRQEFVDSGCELFLWTSYREQQSAEQFMKELSKKRKNVKLKPTISKFLKQLKAVDEEDVAFIYPEDYTPQFLMCSEISKKAKQVNVIDNVFEEDDTINWMAVFDRSDMESIGMMDSIVYSVKVSEADNYGGYKLFGKGLGHYADFLQYNGHLLRPLYKDSLLFTRYQGLALRRDTNPRAILEARKVIEMLIRIGYFEDEYELFYNLLKGLLPAFQKMYEKAEKMVYTSDYPWKEKVNELKSSLIAEGIIKSKWKSEQTLFTLVKKEYPDALFQYRPRWLEPQNLDIYIPSLNVGIEFQGIQHYESVDFFGGSTALEHRKSLDERKKLLCLENDLKLIEWPYTDEITKKMLKQKIKHILEE